MKYVYLWNKRWAVCQDWNPADGSCSFTVIQAAERLTRCFHSLCGNVCVQRNKSWEECSASVSVSFQPVGQDISCMKCTQTPLRPWMGWNLWSLWSTSPDAALEVMVWRPLLLLYWAGGVTSFLLQSRLKSKGSQNTTAATSCQQTSGYNWKHTRSEAPSADAGLVEDKSSLRVQERDSNN